METKEFRVWVNTLQLMFVVDEEMLSHMQTVKTQAGF